MVALPEDFYSISAKYEYFKGTTAKQTFDRLEDANRKKQELEANSSESKKPEASSEGSGKRKADSEISSKEAKIPRIEEPKTPEEDVPTLKKVQEQFKRICLNDVVELTANFDFLRLLAIRKINSELGIKNEKDFPIQKLRVLIDYFEVSIELYRLVDSEECTKIRYWSHLNGCLVWHGEFVRFVEPTAPIRYPLKLYYSQHSARDVSFIFNDQVNELRELDFDIVDYTRGAIAQVPDFLFCYELYDLMHTSRIYVRKLTAKVTKIIDSRLFSMDRLIILMQCLMPGVLRIIEVRTRYDGLHIERPQNEIEIRNFPDFLERRGNYYCYIFHLAFLEQWRRARVLDIRDPFITIDWPQLTHFRIVFVWRLSPDNALNARLAYKDGPPRWGHPNIIIVQEEYDLEAIRPVISEPEIGEVLLEGERTIGSLSRPPWNGIVIMTFHVNNHYVIIAMEGNEPRERG